MKSDLLASSGTLDGIKDCIARFYCGETKDLVPDGENAWHVVRPDGGAKCEGVRVIRKARRFRFEMV